ncbi:MAG: iron uptake transporter permease EfeU [Actinomycetota bacterium]
MGSAFLITLREGLEMALIVAIVLAYLRKVGRSHDAKTVWYGTLAAIAIAVGAGAIIFAAVGELEGKGEAIVEGVVAFLAAGVLTWMVFWMRRQARYIKGELHAKIDAALASGSTLALAGIAFFAVLREGLETALFLLSSSIGSEAAASQAIGGLIGIAIAIAIGYLIYQGSHRINLRTFFTATGVLVLLFAAGLLAKGVHEFQEAGLIGTVHEHVWTIGVGWLNPDTSRFAEFLKGLFGWNPEPSLEMVIVYLAYLIPVGAAFLTGTRGVPATVKKIETEQVPVSTNA